MCIPKTMGSSIRAVLLLLCSLVPLLGQVTGTLRILVTDASGAVITGSQTQVVNVDTNETFTSETNTNGYVVFTPIPRGTYNIQVTSPGFSTAKVASVTIDTNQNRQVPVQLSIATASTTLEVSAATVALQTENASLGALVTGKTVTDMPLAQRRYTDLALLIPGAISPSNNGSGQVNATDVLVNGGRIRGNNFQLDGFDNNGPARVGVLGTNVIVPPPDALTEFNVQSGSFSAESGLAIGAVISVSLRSGTNQLHGAGWLFNRDTVFAANTWQNNHTPVIVSGVVVSPGTDKTPLRWNQPGGMIGGPLIKNKLFYFGDFEAFRQVAAANPLASLPTTAMRGGNFSALTAALTDPAGGTFPGNIIPANRIIPLGQKIVNLYPDPNIPGTVSAGRPANNYTRATETTLTTYKGDVRGDYNYSSQDHYFGRYSANKSNQYGQAVLGAASGDPITLIRNKQATFGWTKTISSGAVNDMRFGYSKQVYDASTTNVGQNVASKFGFLGIPAISDINLPAITVTNYQGLGAGNFNPQFHHPWSLSLSDSMSIVKGRHLFKFGGGWSLKQDDFIDLVYRSTAFSFQGRYTGDAVADILLGLPQSVGAEALAEVHERQQIYYGYAQDQWKVTPSLSLDLGVRYEFYTPFYGVGDYTNVSYDYVKKQLIVAPGGKPPLAFGAVAASNRYAMSPDKNNWAPRLGLAYQIGKRTVFRGAYGWYYDSQDVHGTSPDSLINPPNVYPINLQRVGNGPAPLLLTQPFPSDILDPTKIDSSTVNLNVFPADATASRVAQWNTTLQYQLASRSTIEVGYVGNKARDLDLIFMANNAPWGKDGTVAANRPYPQWATMLGVARGNYGVSQYHALQVKYDRRGKNWSTLTSFTWASATGTTDSTTSTAGNAIQTVLSSPAGPVLLPDSAFANAFPRFRLTNGMNLSLPFGRGQTLLSHMNRVAEAVFGGWQVSYILSVNSGLPLNVTLSANGIDPATGKSYSFFLSQGGGTIRPNQVGPARSAFSPSEDRLHYLNAAGFQVQPVNTPGNAARNAAWTPGLANLDMTLSKSFTFTERQRLEVRLEGFNAFNHTNYSAPNAVFGGTTFGQITTTGPNRVIQMGIKYVF